MYIDDMMYAIYLLCAKVEISIALMHINVVSCGLQILHCDMLQVWLLKTGR